MFQHLTTREPESCFASADSVRSGADDGRVLISASDVQLHLQVAWRQARRSILTSFAGVVERVTPVCQENEAWTPQDAASNWHRLVELV